MEWYLSTQEWKYLKYQATAATATTAGVMTQRWGGEWRVASGESCKQEDNEAIINADNKTRREKTRENII